MPYCQEMLALLGMLTMMVVAASPAMSSSGNADSVSGSESPSDTSTAHLTAAVLNVMATLVASLPGAHRERLFSVLHLAVA
mmetsp:Transcript_47925/g.87940  ORF Transcript_47925/g.87940 Transcript_47925/m.87940 type:complete len:81 (-) Transcript_47925:116-358(-)